MRATSRLWLSLLVCSIANHAVADDAENVSITVVVVGDDAPRRAVRRALEGQSDLPLSLRFGELPNAPEAARATMNGEEPLAAARTAYIGADFEGCLAAVPDDGELVDLLVARDRATAARWLFWRVACLVGAGDAVSAEREALRFAVLGFEVPPDVSAATPEVEAALGAGQRRVEGTSRVPVRVRANAPRAAVSLDGRAGLCVAPCTLDVAPGDHVIAVSADGRVATSRLVRAEEDGGALVHFALEDAPPELAATQWTSRFSTSPEVDSAASVTLLSRAMRSRRFVLLSADALREGARLRGVLALDGEVSARSERASPEAGDVSELTEEVLRELLVRGEVIEPAPSIFTRPLFWIVVGVVAVGAVVATALLLSQPNVRTEVRF